MICIHCGGTPRFDDGAPTALCGACRGLQRAWEALAALYAVRAPAAAVYEARRACTAAIAVVTGR